MIMHLAEFFAQEMRKDGITSIEYGTLSVWREYEVKWCELYHHDLKFPNTSYQRISRALKKSKLFKSTHYIPYNRSNGSGMHMAVYDLADFDPEKQERVYEV